MLLKEATCQVCGHEVENHRAFDPCPQCGYPIPYGSYGVGMSTQAKLPDLEDAREAWEERQK